MYAKASSVAAITLVEYVKKLALFMVRAMFAILNAALSPAVARSLSDHLRIISQLSSPLVYSENLVFTVARSPDQYELSLVLNNSNDSGIASIIAFIDARPTRTLLPSPVNGNLISAPNV